MRTRPGGTIRTDPATLEAEETRSAARVLRTIRDALRLSWAASPKGLVGIAAITFASAALPPVTVWLGKQLVDRVAGAQGARVPVSTLLPAAVALGVVAAGQRAFNQILGHRSRFFAEEVRIAADRLFLQKAAGTDVGHFDDAGWHDRLARAARELNFRPYNLTNQLILLTASIITVGGMLGILFTLHPALVVLALAAVLIHSPLQRRIRRRIYRFHYQLTAKERERHYLRWLLSDTRAAKDLRAYVLEDGLLSRHERLALDLHHEQARLYRQADLYSLVAGLISGAALAAVYVFVAVRGASGALTPGDVTALIGAIASVTGQVNSISNALIAIDENAAFVSDYFAFLEIERLLPIHERPRSIDPAGGIELDDVTFAYEGRSDPALDGCSLRSSRASSSPSSGTTAPARRRW